MSEMQDWSSFVKPVEGGLKTVELAVDGVHCGGCIGRIEKSMKTIPGVVDARLNFTNRRLTLAWSADDFQPTQAADALERMGYKAHPFQAENAEVEEKKQSRWLLRCLAVSGFAAMNVMLLSVSVWSGNVTDITPETRDLFHWVSALIALPAAAYAGQPFFRSAWKALRVRQVNMDVPISLGIILALSMSVWETASHAQHAYFDSAVMLIFFLLCGRYFDHAMRQRTRAVAGNLAALKAETAHRMLDRGEVVQIPAQSVRIDDRLLVRPGERVAADGLIVSGSSHVDESIVSGETASHKVGPGTMLYAGSINLDGTLIMRVTAAGKSTLIDEVEQLLDKAVRDRSRYVRLADRAAGYYAPVVHSAAALTLAGWLVAGASLHDALITAISVLIITCPCALALAIPVVQVVTAGRFFRAGIFLKSGDMIERLAEIDTVIFDKTGTLTMPRPQLVDVETVPLDLRDAAARLALSSLHPLARALAVHARSATPYPDVTEEPGQGVRTIVDGKEMRLGDVGFCGLDRGAAMAHVAGTGASLIAFCWGARSALFPIQQTLRPATREVVAALTALGLDVQILSGDRPPAVAPMAKEAGIFSWEGALKPADKIARLEQLKAEGRKVLMVGDGINDAPALAAAHVSLSPISAADLSQAQADAVFLGERLTPVLDAIVTARKAKQLMTQNLWFAAVYNMFAVPVAVAGLVTPLIAAAAMSGSSILVVLNALRLRAVPRRQSGETERGVPS